MAVMNEDPKGPRGLSASGVPGVPTDEHDHPVGVPAAEHAAVRGSCCWRSSQPRSPRSNSGPGSDGDGTGAASSPAMQLFWFIPTHGDGRYLGTTRGARPVTHAYAAQIARAADDLGFSGVLLPTGRSCEDAWVVASALMPLTRSLRFLVAI